MIPYHRPATAAAALVLGLALALTPDLATAARNTAWDGPTAAQFAGDSARDRVKRLVVVEAERAGVPPALALALAKVSSDFQPLALSTSGAIGVMQIMPATARRDLGLDPEELKEPRLNIEVGLDRLRRFHDQLGDWELALAAYQGGLDALGRLRQAASRAFVERVLEWADRYAAQGRLWAALDAREEGWQPPRAPVPPRGTAVDRIASGETWPHVHVVSRTGRGHHVAALDRDFVDIETRRREAQWRIDDFGPRPNARAPAGRGW